MTFVDLPSVWQYIILMLALIDIVAILVLYVVMCQERKWEWRHKSILCYTIVLLIDFGYLSYMYYQSSNFPGDTSKDFIHIAIHIFIILRIYLLCIYGHFRENKYRKTVFGNSSIREAIDNIPISISVSDENGYIILANRSMYETGRWMIGEDILNVEHFWRVIEDAKEINGHIRLDSYTDISKGIITFKMSDATILRVTRDDIVIKNESFIQTTISHVTRLHELYKSAESDTEKLKQQRKEIKKLTDETIQYNHLEEVLKYKIQIHNELGEMILATRQMLNENLTPDECRKQAEKWYALTMRLSDIDSSNDNQTTKSQKQMNEILEIAEQIGCNVTIDEDVDIAWAEIALVRQAVREAIVNAVKHGRAENVHITAYNKNASFIGIRIYNDGSINGKIVPSGGLLNLKNGLRAMGGELEFEIKDKICIIISVPKSELNPANK